MMRLVGVNIPDNKRVEIALTYVYGIGHSLAREILNISKIDLNKRAKNLTPEEINSLKEILEKKYKIEGDLRQSVRQNIARLKEIQCYRGIRHLKRLPVRGQRTKTNSRTVRGNVRKTVSSGKRKTELK
ncbi:30S ribosomal protein S13 [Candidatus Wolfebacteria bacterium CG03_land_8_20_14_0_80_40_12]|uniref:Small ribosomal subunit protein uS13 n=1 Tax=Candidatus Wolfebacteria bacterium CG03_land_8_20_14_0_80_40_12 TaxID=1975069 RepID=A0A2M7B5U5_9BACT|nr:MAG: 30S ribosomal protein S13 [Candidatus Wolfebacteria bacterium CG03_land_8_20_14_0_80_40_12]